jgi:hypothetical protein
MGCYLCMRSCRASVPLCRRPFPVTWPPDPNRAGHSTFVVEMGLPLLPRCMSMQIRQLNMLQLDTLCSSLLYVSGSFNLQSMHVSGSFENSLGQYVRKVISGSGNRSNPRPDRGRLPCMAVDPLSHSATIKGGQVRAREPTFIVPTVPPQTLTT